MRTLSLAVAVAGSLFALAPAAMAQQDQGWRGTLDQLNRTINPDNQRPDTQEDDRRAREMERDRGGQYDRRMEGSSGRSDRASPELRRYSDEDIRGRWSRLSDEQRQLQRERRVLEEEMSRRGMRR